MRDHDPQFYVGPAAYRREQNHIFWSSWQLLGPVGRLEESGAYIADEIAGARVIVVRGEDGVLRAFRNICRHRDARLLAEGTVRCNSIRCPYHNWVYGLDGSLRRAPAFGETEDLDPADWPLHQIHVETWRGLVFIAIEPAGPLQAQLAATVPELKDESIESFTCVAEHRMTFDANWNIYTDNFVEGHHIPGIHPELAAAIDFYQFETTAHDNLVRMTATPRESLFSRGKWLWMWPNWTLSLFEGGMNTSCINPLAPDRTEPIHHFYFADTGADTETALQEIIDRNLAVIVRDFEIGLETRKNHASGGYQPGPLSSRHEADAVWFQGRVREELKL